MANCDGPFQNITDDLVLHCLSGMYLCFQHLLHFNAVLMFPGIIDAPF